MSYQNLLLLKKILLQTDDISVKDLCAINEKMKKLVLQEESEKM